MSVKLNCSLIADTYNNIYFNKTIVYVMIKAIVFWKKKKNGETTEFMGKGYSCPLCCELITSGQCCFHWWRYSGNASVASVMSDPYFFDSTIISYVVLSSEYMLYFFLFFLLKYFIFISTLNRREPTLRSRCLQKHVHTPVPVKTITA